ncbi:MAG: T9SS type A sorting domain-containing protein [Candidatus Marinimicrobia bacterium]|nr:T9SS type A sorting domain-containing protein [Candidatus Neomarinimicrobiota bacterium]
MKKLKFVLPGLFFLAVLFAIPYTPPAYDMLVLSSWDFSQEEVSASIDSQRAVYETWLDTPGMYSKGQTGLFILDLFAIRDTLTGAVEFQQQIMFNMIDEMFHAVYFGQQSLDFILGDVEDQYELIDNLYAFMTEGKKDSLVAMGDSIKKHLEDTYFMTLENIDNTAWELSQIGDTLGGKFEAILNSGEDFTFRIGAVHMEYDSVGFPYIDTSDVVTLYDESFLCVAVAANNIFQGFEYFGNGIKNVFEGEETEIAGGIDTLILSMRHFEHALDTLNNPYMFSLIDSSILADIRGGVVEVDSLLNGKTYFIEDVEIRPVGILENVQYGLYQTYIDIYWQPDPYLYTFRNIFPAGLPAEIVEQILPDMILDPRDTREEMTNYLTTLGASYSATLFLNPYNVDAHVGLGYIELLAMIQDVADQGRMIAALADGGRIDSLFQNYDWTNIDYTDEIASIRMRLDHHYSAMMSGDTVIYTLLIKDPNRSAPGHVVQEGDLLYPVYIIPQVTNGIVQFTYHVENAVMNIKNGIKMVYAKIDSMVDITLDPNLLDLSNIEEPLDLIYALETSNPNFGAFTPEGKVMFAALGDSIAVGMQYMSAFADTVVATLEYAEMLMYEFGMSETDFDTLMMNIYRGNLMMHEMAVDFAVPDAYTRMDEENVNLSAWFDNVPDNLLTVMKNYFEGTDSSMAGFFPDRMIEEGVEPNVIPQEFALKSNYPNPFNPMTTIAFDLPREGLITMSVFDITGRRVETLIDRQSMQAGSYELTWNAAKFASGIYILRLHSGNEIAYRKMTLLK